MLYSRKIASRQGFKGTVGAITENKTIEDCPAVRLTSSINKTTGEGVSMLLQNHLHLQHTAMIYSPFSHSQKNSVVLGPGRKLKKPFSDCLSPMFLLESLVISECMSFLLNVDIALDFIIAYLCNTREAIGEFATVWV